MVKKFSLPKISFGNSLAWIPCCTSTNCCLTGPIGSNSPSSLSSPSSNSSEIFLSRRYLLSSCLTRAVSSRSRIAFCPAVTSSQALFIKSILIFVLYTFSKASGLMLNSGCISTICSVVGTFGFLGEFSRWLKYKSWRSFSWSKTSISSGVNCILEASSGVM